MDNSSRLPPRREVHYREQAAQLREMAKTAPHGTLAEQLLRLADQYDRLAERLGAAAIASEETVSEGARSPPEKEVYRSSNGDCWYLWYLVRDPGSERMLVRHQPNRASGGSSSLICVEDFLAEGHSPQQEALLRLIGEEPREAGRQ
jgi:hypothetical protein